MRDWAKANSDTLVRYLRAYIEGCRWVLDPTNRIAAIELLADRFKLSREIAAKSYAVATDPGDRLAEDARFNMEGFKNVLKLRAEIEGQWDGKPPTPERYVDLSYYDKALAMSH
jgi:ABC-type nitrate/sulfonate/bicarbonate transport system substrate-binding protein